MEKGNFRCDANVSIRAKGASQFGIKAELKNINSFRFIEKAIEYEIERQIAVIEAGGAITQETRLWDAERQKTFSMREKESAHDYRYFPDPDLPPLVIESTLLARLQAEIPELPAKKKRRFTAQLGLSANDAAILTNDRELADYFEKTAQICGDANAACHWVVNDVLAGLPTKIEAFPVSAERLGRLIELVKSETINTKTAKSIFLRMHDDNRDAAAIVEAEGLGQISDDNELETIVQQIVDAHPTEVERYRAGDKKLFGFFMGRLMAISKGKANPATAKALLQARLDT
jgi:aspartyl-tRNA(Asn)/glutamyl-tRNA(Gln) amidotransferase subunit B